MKKLIELDAASEIVRFECGKWEGLANTIIKEFYAIKPVDAVPVVRCAACRYFRCNMRGDGTLRNGVCVLGRGGYDPMDFCSEGERKEGEGRE